MVINKKNKYNTELCWSIICSNSFCCNSFCFFYNFIPSNHWIVNNTSYIFTYFRNYILQDSKYIYIFLHTWFLYSHKHLSLFHFWFGLYFLLSNLPFHLCVMGFVNVFDSFLPVIISKTIKFKSSVLFGTHTLLDSH